MRKIVLLLAAVATLAVGKTSFYQVEQNARIPYNLELISSYHINYDTLVGTSDTTLMKDYPVTRGTVIDSVSGEELFIVSYKLGSNRTYSNYNINGKWVGDKSSYSSAHSSHSSYWSYDSSNSISKTYSSRSSGYGRSRISNKESVVYKLNNDGFKISSDVVSSTKTVSGIISNYLYSYKFNDSNMVTKAEETCNDSVVRRDSFIYDYYNDTIKISEISEYEVSDTSYEYFSKFRSEFICIGNDTTEYRYYNDTVMSIDRRIYNRFGLIIESISYNPISEKINSKTVSHYNENMELEKEEHYSNVSSELKLKSFRTYSYLDDATSNIESNSINNSYNSSLPKFSVDKNRIMISLSPKLIGSKNISIIDLSGRELLSKNINSSSVSVNISSLPSGVYIAKIKGDGANIISRKFFK